MEKTEKTEKTNTFVGFILLDEQCFSPNLVFNELKNRWGITDKQLEVAGEMSPDKPIVIEYDGMMLAIMYVDMPVPNGEAVLNAKSSYFWPDAVAVAQGHKAHLIVSVLGGENGSYDTSIVFTKLCDSCLALPNAVGVNVFATVYEPKMYRAEAILLDKGDIPTPILAYIGIYNTPEGVCAYTFGLEYYGKKEIEIVNSQEAVEDVYNIIYGIVSYVISSDVILSNGETIGFSEEQKLEISLSTAFVQVLKDETLKIRF